MTKDDVVKGLKNRRIEIKSKEKIGQRLKRELTSIEQQLATLTKGDILVTDHARIRYLERVKGLNIEELDKEILPEGTIALMQRLGLTSLKIKCATHKVVIENGILKTVIPPK